MNFFRNKKLWIYLFMGFIICAQLFVVSFLVYQKLYKEASSPAVQGEHIQEVVTIEKPVRLLIPQLQIDSVIEPVGQNSLGDMDVPSSAETVAWYQLGVLPGERGNAVISGHYDTEEGKPAVFADLQQLKPGDTITVEDANNEERTFSVYKTEIYPFDASPLEEIFGSTTSAHLNLITCEGEWDEAKKTYKDRLVVFARLQE